MSLKSCIKYAEHEAQYYKNKSQYWGSEIDIKTSKKYSEIANFLKKLQEYEKRSDGE